VVDRPDMRISDADRQLAGERLRHAMGEGRLDFAEYDNRLAQAYDAKTYRDLDQLFADLPGPAGPDHPVVRVTPNSVVSTPGQRATVPAPPRATHLVPTPLKVLWTIWVAVVAINLTVWLLVSIGNGDLQYFWPMWLLVPGVALFGVTAGIVGSRVGGRSH
jgi:hypothetical protein